MPRKPKKHLLTALNRPACGSRGNLKYVDDPEKVTCINCKSSWAWAVAMGCEDESRGGS